MSLKSPLGMMMFPALSTATPKGMGTVREERGRRVMASNLVTASLRESVMMRKSPLREKARLTGLRKSWEESSSSEVLGDWRSKDGEEDVAASRMTIRLFPVSATEILDRSDETAIPLGW
jgi:hypothetical protein